MVVVVVEETISLKRKRGRPEKDEPPLTISRKDSRALLDGYDAKKMAGLLEKCFGDIDTYVRCFDNHIATQKDILARTIYTLKQPGNEVELEKWNAMVESCHESKLLLARSEAVKLLTDLRPPQRSGKNAGSAFDKTMQYAKFILAQTAKKEARPGRAPNAVPAGGGAGGEADAEPPDFVSEIENGVD